MTYIIYAISKITCALYDSSRMDRNSDDLEDVLQYSQLASQQFYINFVCCCYCNVFEASMQLIYIISGSSCIMLSVHKREQLGKSVQGKLQRNLYTVVKYAELNY